MMDFKASFFRGYSAVMIVMILVLQVQLYESFTATALASSNQEMHFLLSRVHHGDDSWKEDELATVIGKGTSLKADVLELGSTLVVHGTLNINSVTTSHPCNVMVGPSGLLQGDVLGLETVQVCGRLEGRVKCVRLIIDEQGEIIGDVYADTLILRPGGRIQGAVHCGQVGSELKIFEETKRPLQISPDYTSSPARKRPMITPSTARDKAGVALRALSSHHQLSSRHFAANPSSSPSMFLSTTQLKSKEETPKPLLDHFGNPLIGSAPEHHVDAFRKNRELVHATRVFLDNAKVIKQQCLDQDEQNDEDDFLPAFLR